MYSRGKFGIEYTPSEPDRESSGLGRVMLVVALVVVVLVARAVWTRVRARPDEQTVELRADDLGEAASRLLAANAPAADRPADSSAEASAASVAPVPSADPRPPAGPVREVDYGNRPVKVRNLLLRLAEAERLHDVEMQISTIEQLRAAPGTADLDDMLARKVGVLNFRRLFAMKSAQWTTDAKVKRGDSATRIAYEHGSTLASLAKLNGDKIDKLKVGQVLKVMNHPRFNLVITRRTRTADLSLNGKFFKRYYLTDEVEGAEGSYVTPERFRTFCTEKGVPFKPLDRAELEMLLPKGSAAFITEI